MSTMLATDHEGPDLLAASRKLYDAEVALHIARQTGVDAWIKAAAERLHDAILLHLACASPSAESIRS